MVQNVGVSKESAERLAWQQLMGCEGAPHPTLAGRERRAARRNGLEGHRWQAVDV